MGNKKRDLMTPTSEAQLMELGSYWENLARCKFIQAEAEDDPFAKRFIEHGATCYFNCTSQLRQFLQARNASPEFVFKALHKNSKRPRGRRL